MLDWSVERLYIALLLAIAFLVIRSVKWVPRTFLGVNLSLLIVSFSLLWVYYSVCLLITLFSPTTTDWRDLLETSRFVIYGTIFVFIASNQEMFHAKTFQNAVIASLFYCLAVFILYIYDFPLVSHFFRDILYVDSKNQIVLDGIIRLAAPFENPNFLAFYLVMVLTYLLFFANDAGHVAYVLVAIVCLFLTGSRSGWIAGASVLGFYFIMTAQESISFSTREGLKRSIFIILFIAVALLLFGDALLMSQRITLMTSSI